MQANSQVSSPAANQGHNNSATPKVITGNGEENVLGYGFASSYELSKRGYRDGITVQTLGDMNEGVSLVLAEYQADLDKQILKPEYKKRYSLPIISKVFAAPYF